MGSGGRSRCASVCTPASSSGARSLSTSRNTSVFASAWRRPGTAGGVRARAARSSSSARRVDCSERCERASLSFASRSISIACDCAGEKKGREGGGLMGGERAADDGR
jgi:hypothetical protein